MCFIVKDGEKYLKKNLNTFRDLVYDSGASEVHFYAVENDSTDSTKEDLQSLYANGYIHNVEHLTLDGRVSWQVCRDSGLKHNCLARVDRLGMLRQRAVNAALSTGEYDYLCMIDMDFVAMPSLRDMFAFMDKHPHINGIFGLSTTVKQRKCVYDIAASTNLDLGLLLLSRSRYARVSSGFGGVGIYRVAAVRAAGATYVGTTNVRCEHMRFNSHFENLIIDTKFRPVYDGVCHLFYVDTLRTIVYIALVCLVMVYVVRATKSRR